MLALALRYRAALAVALVAASPLLAANTFIGPAQSSWSNPAHWSSGLPASNPPAHLTFLNDYNNRQPVVSRNDFPALRVARLEFLSRSADNLIRGNLITLSGQVITSTGNWQSIEAPLELSAGSQIFDVRAGRIRLLGSVGGPGTLVKAGGATLTIEAPASHLGGTVVELGVLHLGTGGESGAVRGELTAKPGTIISSNAKDSLGYREGLKVDVLNLTGARFIHESSEPLTLSSLELNLSGGVLTTSGGPISFYNARHSGDSDYPTAIRTHPYSQPSVISGRVHLRQGDDSPVPTVFNVAEGSASVDLRIEAALADGPHQGARSSIQKSGPGLLELAAINTYTGVTRLRDGTLFLGIDHALPDYSPVILEGGTLAADSRIDRTGPLLLQSSSIITLGDGGALTFADSSAQPWSGTLRIEGALRDGASIRFGDNENGLTMPQLARIQINGQPAAIDSLGYLSALPALP